MTFADINNDRYTDIITVNDQKTSFTVHLFDPTKRMFNQSRTFQPSDCTKITNVVVGRSIDKLRIFLTCLVPSNSQSSVNGFASVIKIFDKTPKTLDLIEQNIKINIETGS